MKNTIIMLLLCLLSGQAVSQEVSFYLHIMDKERIVSYYESVPIFDDPEINSIDLYFGKYAN